MTYKFISDPGHGWLKVPTLEVAKLGLVSSITPYSYIEPSGKYMYLEEDCDVHTFMVAKAKAAGNASGSNEKETREWCSRWWKRNVIEVFEENTKIRGFQHVRPITGRAA